MSKEKSSARKDENLHQEIGHHVNNVLRHEIEIMQNDVNTLNRTKFRFVVDIPADPNDMDSSGGHAETNDTTIDIAIKLAIEKWKTRGGGFGGYLSHRHFTISIRLASDREILVPNVLYKEKVHQILHEMEIGHHDHYFE